MNTSTKTDIRITTIAVGVIGFLLIFFYLLINNTEIGGGRYKQIREMLHEHPDMLPYVEKAMEDNKITVGEMDKIIIQGRKLSKRDFKKELFQ